MKFEFYVNPRLSELLLVSSELLQNLSHVGEEEDSIRFKVVLEVTVRVVSALQGRGLYRQVRSDKQLVCFQGAVDVLEGSHDLDSKHGVALRLDWLQETGDEVGEDVHEASDVLVLEFEQQLVLTLLELEELFVHECLVRVLHVYGFLQVGHEFFDVFTVLVFLFLFLFLWSECGHLLVRKDLLHIVLYICLGFQHLCKFGRWHGQTYDFVV
jgi:hypothetical protein